MKSKQPDAGDPLLFPDDPKKSKRTKDGLRPNPEEKANIFSRITFMWVAYVSFWLFTHKKAFTLLNLCSNHMFQVHDSIFLPRV